MAVRDLTKLPREEVDALRRFILDGFAPGGDMDRALAASQRLRTLVDACPPLEHERAGYQWTPNGRVAVPRWAYRQTRGRKPGSKVVNGRVIPPPVTVPITSQRVVTEGAWSELDSLSPAALERLRASLLGPPVPTSHRITAAGNKSRPADGTTPTE